MHPRCLFVETLEVSGKNDGSLDVVLVGSISSDEVLEGLLALREDALRRKPASAAGPLAEAQQRLASWAARAPTSWTFPASLSVSTMAILCKTQYPVCASHWFRCMSSPSPTTSSS